MTWIYVHCYTRSIVYEYPLRIELCKRIISSQPVTFLSVSMYISLLAVYQIHAIQCAMY